MVGVLEITYDSAGDVSMHCAETTMYSLNVTVAGYGAGSIASYPAGIDCGSDCSAEYLVGTQVTLSTRDGNDYKFQGWSGDCSGIGVCVVSMDGAKNVTATFQRVIWVMPRMYNESDYSGWGRGNLEFYPRDEICRAGLSPGYNDCDPVWFFVGETATIIAAPVVGTFDHWQADLAGLCPSDNSLMCQFTVTESTPFYVSIEAWFSPP
jgi:hypothetical protein